MNEDMTMSTKEVDRWYLVKQAMERKMKQSVIAEELGMTERQVRRLVARGRKEGKKGMRHGLKGRVSAKRIATDEREAVAGAIQERYGDFGPTLAQEHHTQNRASELLGKTKAKKPTSAKNSFDKWVKSVKGT